MDSSKDLWREHVASCLKEIVRETDPSASCEGMDNIVVAEIPPDPAMGDLGFPMFPFAKILRKSPAQIAEKCVSGMFARKRTIVVGLANKFSSVALKFVPERFAAKMMTRSVKKEFAGK